MVSSKCVVSLRPTPSERHYCTDTARIPCDRQPTMSLSETDTSDNCLYCCLAVPLLGFGNDRVMPFCPPMPLLSLIICFTTFLLLYKRQFLSTQAYLNVADRSATSNMPQSPAARTRHICHADKSARFVRCATISSYLIYVTIYL